ncbi:MAG: adenylate/guanylate cyclase domain-containing protein [Candidatus ainarchaeum sp.]|nr:adenylate/guanylate cyclase domain-containing protein [Candidatus ainarchaeum sp.]
MPLSDKIGRMDFIQHIENLDEETGIVTFRFEPDPKRYDRKLIDGEWYLFDKFDEIHILEKEVYNKLMKNLGKLPLRYNPPQENDIEKLLLPRIDYIKHFLNIEVQNYNPVDKSEDFLSELNNDTRKYTILSIDLKGSTKLSQNLAPDKNVKLISLFSREMDYIVTNYQGFVLKYLGDGIIAYFPEPNFQGMTDNAVYCASTMKLFIEKIMNPILKSQGYPELQFRIGLDSGEVTSIIIGGENKQHKDLIGETMNIVVKIQSKADTNSILVGDSTVRNSHTYWREKFTEKQIDWEYKEYKIYELKGFL